MEMQQTYSLKYLKLVRIRVKWVYIKDPHTFVTKRKLINSFLWQAINMLKSWTFTHGSL